jgi:putative ABC transport system ATP-binding protein
MCKLPQPVSRGKISVVGTSVSGCPGDRFCVFVSMIFQPSSQPLIEIRDVVKVYSTAAGEFSALNGINLQVGAGEFVGIVGKSGAGKSTLLNMITGVDDLTSGEVLVHSTGDVISIHNLSEDEIALWRGRNLGVVYQSFQLLPMLTLVENITLPMDLCGLFRPKESRERALELLRLVEIEEHANKLPAFISGGQQQRVAIARALANDPPILVADEPTGSLDSITADHIFDVFEHLVSEQGKTIVMVTHDNSLAPRFSRHLTLADGEIVRDENRPARRQAPVKDRAPRRRSLTKAQSAARRETAGRRQRK